MFAETETLAGPTPEVGDEESHPPPLVVVTVTVKLNAPPPETESDRLCEAGLLPPACPANVRELGDTLTVGGAAMFSVTGTVVGDPLERLTDTCPV